MQQTICVGTTVYCLIDGDIKKRTVLRFTTDGEDLVIVTDQYDYCVFQRDAFVSKAEAAQEMRTRLRDC